MRQSFEQTYMRTLRHIYDTEKQLHATLTALASGNLDADLVAALATIEQQSNEQAVRLEEIFRTLYQEPRTEAAWVTTALLREAWQASREEGDGATETCAVALLALKRYELTLYESLLRWSEVCGLTEALPSIRRCIAEELLQTSILSGFAFSALPAGETEPEAVTSGVERTSLH